MSNANIIFGSITGTGAPIDIQLGFVPSNVTVINVTAVTHNQLEWYQGMAAGSAIKTVTDAGAAVDPRTRIAANGITPLDATFLGFRIGAEAGVNVAGQTIVWRAERNGMGSGR